MSGGKTILALDLATVMGWAQGRPGETPTSGFHRFAPPGSGRGAISAGAIKWYADWIKVSRPDLIYIEAPIAPSIMAGRTNMDALMILIGLCFTFEGLASTTGIWGTTLAAVHDVRGHFIGSRRMKSADAKRATVAKCQQLGWMGKSDRNDNQADALALWSYACACVDPQAATRTEPMFLARAFDART